MKFTVERSALLGAMMRACGVIEDKNTIPILSHVRLWSDPEGIRLAGTDMDMEISERVQATTETYGWATVPAHTLYEILRKLPSGSNIEITGDDSPTAAKLILRCGRSRFTLKGLDPSEFPEFLSNALDTRFDLSATDLRALINLTNFAVSTEPTRYYLNGIYLHVVGVGAGIDPVLRATATDGHRLALAETTAPRSATAMPSIIVPRKTIVEISRIIKDLTGDITVAVSQTQVQIVANGVTLTSKLVDGNYPEYDRVIPEYTGGHVMVTCSDIAEAVERVSTIHSDQSKAVRMVVPDGDGGGSALRLESTGTGGSADEEINCACAGAAAGMTIGFNSGYLLDILGVYQGADMLRIEMTDPSAPVAITSPALSGATFVLMPMRV